jgi:hypothetical protein
MEKVLRHNIFGFIFIFTTCFTFFSQTKHALVVAVADYPTYTDANLNWSDLSAMNDVDLLKELFTKQSFDKQNVAYLLNKNATSVALHKAFDSITKTLAKGDIFYFHFSGHGQQVGDLDPSRFPNIKFLKQDEEDGLDETLVLYNAPQRNFDGYDFSEHFYDDQLNYHLGRIQEKLGSTGQVIVVIDACHSGSATRGAEEIVVRGSQVTMLPEGYQVKQNADESLGYDADLNYKVDQGLAPMVAFFGCKAEQVNREIRDRNGKGYGSLTFYFTKSFYELKDKSSFQNLFSKINEKMILQFRSEQNPVFEGTNLNSLIFNGKVIEQDPFFELTTLFSSTSTIAGGQLQGLQVGDSIGFYPNTTMEIKGLKPNYVGIVTEVGIHESTVQLTSNYRGSAEDYVKYRAFSINPVNEANLIYIKLGMASKTMKKEAQKFFEQHPDVRIVDANFSYLLVDTLINNQTKARVYIGNNQTNPLRGMPFRQINSVGAWDTLLTELRQSVRTDVFRKLELESDVLNVDVKLLKSDKTELAPGQLVFKDKELFIIRVTNNSDLPLYFNLVDIYPTNQIDIPSKTSNLLLGVNQSKEIPIRVGKPYGMEQFKLLFTEKSVDLSTLQQNGSQLTRGGDSNPLLQYVDAQSKGTRGASVGEIGNVLVKSLTFEITKP